LVGTAGGFGGKKKESVVLFLLYTTPGTITSLNLKQKIRVCTAKVDFKAMI
jgi:hypothetical protein